MRNALLVGEDPRKYIEEYSKEFLNNFLTQLRTSHQEKAIHANIFYQTIVADKTVSFFYSLTCGSCWMGLMDAYSTYI